MQAEDLNVYNILTTDISEDQHRFRGALDPVSMEEHLVRVDQEYRMRTGHVSLLNLRELVQPVTARQRTEYPLLTRVCDEVHRQGGLVVTAHYGNSPGVEPPIDVALGKLDGVEVLCTGDPHRPPRFTSFTLPQRPESSVLRLWYRLLNSGFRIPAVGGTDKMDNQVSAGANRTYCYVEDAFTYDTWIRALRAGAGFITNSPLLLLTVDENRPGATIRRAADDTAPLRVRVEAASQMPINELEIVVNGKVAACTEIRDQHSATLDYRFVPDRSVWIAARVRGETFSDEERGTNFLSRTASTRGTPLTARFGTLFPETAFAHTNPVFVYRDGQPIRVAESARYYVEYCDRAIRWLEERGRFRSQREKADALDLFQQAREIFAERAGEL